MKNNKLKILTLALLFLGPACQSSEELAQKGMEALTEGKKVTALRFFEEALHKDKKHPLSLFGKGKILLDSVYTFHLGQQMIEESLSSIKPPYKESAYLELAGSYARSNQYERSIEILEQAEKQKIQSQAICLKQVFYKIQMRQFAPAKNKVNLCLEKYPGDTDLLLMAGLIEAKRKKYSAAITLFEEAHKGAPENKEVIKKLAIAHYLQKDTNECVSYLKMLMKKQVDQEQKNKIKSWIKLANQKRWEVSL